MPHQTSDKYVEKLFLYLLAFSLLLHVALFVVIVNLPQGSRVPKSEPFMVDLRDLPLPKSPAPPLEKTPRRVEKAERPASRGVPGGRGGKAEQRIVPPARPTPTPSAPSQQPREAVESSLSGRVGREPSEPPRGESLFKPKEQRSTDIARLFPRAEKLARLEEGYRRKYAAEVEEGGAAFLNTEDIQLGSFMQRFETAVYGVWRYPPEAARLGIQGVTPVRITFKRNGEIEDIVLLDTSGSAILDGEVLRTLRSLGPIGPLPRNYGKDRFNLIAFFNYRIVGGAIRGVLR